LFTRIQSIPKNRRKRMKKAKVILLGTVAFLFLLQTHVFADVKPIKKGDKFPEFKFSAPKDPKEQEYLGITGKDTFTVSDIQTEVVILQMFHSG
jgi:hypothetical protein